MLPPSYPRIINSCSLSESEWILLLGFSHQLLWQTLTTVTTECETLRVSTASHPYSFSFFSVNDVVSIFISKARGQHIASLVDNGTKVEMQISVGRQHNSHYSSINKTSVLFVSISFIVLMIISLAWLVFYYIQRFRYAHAKERLSVRALAHLCAHSLKNLSFSSLLACIQLFWLGAFQTLSVSLLCQRVGIHLHLSCKCLEIKGMWRNYST